MYKTPGLEIFTCKPNREVPQDPLKSMITMSIHSTSCRTSLYSIEGTTSLPHFFRLSDPLLDAKKTNDIIPPPKERPLLQCTPLCLSRRSSAALHGCLLTLEPPRWRRTWRMLIRAHRQSTELQSCIYLQDDSKTFAWLMKPISLWGREWAVPKKKATRCTT